ncbi:uncharacterized protein LOC143527560 isoform X1 [Brachyhypopomus gauderio]|uniref:uncharacterized protein LOC143527554 isoform X1 n=1 Tax=Brachyhypopomus gauderio TaxID=698409 RepID=UPI004042A534
MESLSEMEQRLVQEGLSVDASSSERLALLWRLYVEKDKRARELTRNILELRLEHAAELKIASRRSGQENLLEERKCLEKDVAEATSRLHMAHGEIHRLTEELESARSALRAYESELQAAQLEIEQLRQEIEDWKRHDVAEHIKVEEVKEFLVAEVLQLKTTVHKMNTDCLQLLELVKDTDRDEGDSDEAFTQKLSKSQILSTTSSSKVKRKKALQDIHKRCREEMEEMEARLEQETLQRKKAVEECEDQRKRRQVAEDLTLQLQELQEQKNCDHEAEIQHLQKQIDLLEEIDEVNVEKSQRQDRKCAQHLQLLESLTTELDWVRTTLHEEKEQAKQQHLAEQAKLQDSWTWCKRLNEELKRIRDLLMNSDEQLLAQSERNSQHHSSINVLEQDLETCQPQEQDQYLFQHEQVDSVVREQLNAEKTHSKHTNNLELELRDMVAEMSTLKNQVENSQQQWKRLAVREEELRLEVESLLANNAQLSQAKAELARQVQDLEITKEKLTLSQQDYEKVHTQLQEADVNLSFQISKQHDRKLRHRERLCKAKEVYLRETAWRDEKIVEQQRELEILSMRLQRESDMVKMVQTENEALLLNKKELLCRLNEEEGARASAVATTTSMHRRLDLLKKELWQRDEKLIKYIELDNLIRQLLNCQSLTASEDLKRLILLKTQISEGTV